MLVCSPLLTALKLKTLLKQWQWCNKWLQPKNIHLLCKKEKLNLQLQLQKIDCRAFPLKASPLVPKYQCQYTHLNIGQLGETWSWDLFTFVCIWRTVDVLYHGFRSQRDILWYILAYIGERKNKTHAKC